MIGIDASSLDCMDHFMLHPPCMVSSASHQVFGQEQIYG